MNADRIVDAAIAVSASVAGRVVGSWRLQEASIIFAKTCTTGLSAQKCNPLSKYYAPAGPYRLWDVSSYATLCRSLVEIYLTLFYVGVENVPAEELEFRRFLWIHHKVVERFKMVSKSLPESPELGQFEQEVVTNRNAIVSHQFYARLAKDRQKIVRCGKDCKYLNDDELCIRSGMSSRYFSAMFKYLSNHTHTSPFALAEMDAQRAGSDGARDSFVFISEILAQFCAICVRDIIAITPDPKPVIGDEIRADIEDAEHILKWEKAPAFAGNPLS